MDLAVICNFGESIFNGNLEERSDGTRCKEEIADEKVETGSVDDFLEGWLKARKKMCNSGWSSLMV